MASLGSGAHSSGQDADPENQPSQGSEESRPSSSNPAPAAQPRRPRGSAKGGSNAAITQTGVPKGRAAPKTRTPGDSASMPTNAPQKQPSRPPPPPQLQQSGAAASRNKGSRASPALQQQAEEDEQEEDEEEEAEFSLEEAESLIFGDKDFTLGGEVPVDAATVATRSRDALSTIGLSQEAMDLLLLLQSQDRAPRDPEGLGAKVQAAAKVVGSVGGILAALDQLAAALSVAQGPGGAEAKAPGGEWQPSREDAAAAMLQAPKVLAMPATAIQQRVSELEAILKVTPRRTRELCCSSPALLLVPKSLLLAKLKALQQTTGLSAEVCAAMVSVHMFPELRLG